MERDYLDYNDWFNDGALEGTGQKVEDLQYPPPMTPAAPQQNGTAGQYDWNLDPNATPPAPEQGFEYYWSGSNWAQRALGSTIGKPQPPTGGGNGGGGGGGGRGGDMFGGKFGYLTEPFTGRAPAWRSGPSLDLPTFMAPPPFSYKEFQAPTKDSMYADPSYQFREQQGQQALEQSAAGRGVLRTGGTLKHLVDYGQNAASQEYSNMFGRAVDAHNLGLQQALGTYGTNYGVSRDTQDRLFNEKKAEFEPQQRDNEQMNQREFDSFLADYDIFEKNRRRAGDYLTWAADQGGK